MLIPMMAFVCAWVYPVYVNLFNRETVDARRETDLGIVPAPTEKELALQDSHVGEKEEVSTGEQKEVL